MTTLHRNTEVCQASHLCLDVYSVQFLITTCHRLCPRRRLLLRRSALPPPRTLGAGAWATHLEAGSGSRYTPTTTFETFPFPWPPGQEPQRRPARRRPSPRPRPSWWQSATRWLNPPGASRSRSWQEAHAHQPLQRAAHLARPGAPEARRGRASPPTAGRRPDRRGNPGAAAGAESGAGAVGSHCFVGCVSRFWRGHAVRRSGSRTRGRQTPAAPHAPTRSTRTRCEHGVQPASTR